MVPARDRQIRFATSGGTDFHREVRRAVVAQLAATGTTRFADYRLWAKAAGLAIVASTSYGLMVTVGLPGWAMLGLAAIWGITTLLLAINLGHDAAHEALTPRRWINRLLHHASFALVGCDAYLWRMRHVRSHHNFPNAAGCDIDIDENPLLRLSPHHPRRPWQRWQHLYAPLVYSIVGLHTACIGDFVYLRKQTLADMRDIRHPPAALLSFAVGKLVFFGLTFAIPLAMLDRPWWQIVLGSTVSSAAASLAFISLLVGTHFATEADFPTQNARGVLPGDWAAHAVRTSIDWSPGSRLANFLSGGANCHVAHHLFPAVSHVHYRAITPTIAMTAARHGLPYRAMSPAVLLASHFRLLHRLARTAPVLSGADLACPTS